MTTELQNGVMQPMGAQLAGLIPQIAAAQVFCLGAIAPGPAQIVASSASLGWRGLLLEQHLSSPGGRKETWNEGHVISLLHGRPARFESRSDSGHTIVYNEMPGSLTIMPPGPVPDIRLHTNAEFIYCAIEDGVVNSARAEMEESRVATPTFRKGIRDTSIQRILELLMAEMQARIPSGKVYVESLAYALATRYLLLDGRLCASPESRISALPPRILNRVRERIEAGLCDDVSLEALAEESGYSRAHFLRMFRAATGRTPHQYILDVRLNHAREWLRKKNTSLIDIAAFCGFSSQSHMTSVFRKRLGVTPAEFRRVH